MTAFAYSIDADSAEPIDPEAALMQQCEFAWIHVEGIDAAAKAWLSGPAGLDEHVVEALTAAETRPRCEAFADGALLNLRGRTNDELDSSDLLASVRIWAIKGRLFSVARTSLVAVEAVRGEVGTARVRDPGDLITAFATAITNDLDPHVADLGDRLDDCEEQLDAGRVFEHRRVVSQVRVAAIGYRRFLYPQRDALERLAALPGEWLGEEDRIHLAAAADRAARMAEELEAIRERAAVMHDTLSDLRAEQIDNRALVISIAAMVFLPLTFITGLYGMNVEGLPFAQEPWAFAAIAIGCLAIAVGIVGYFVRGKWLSG